MKDSKGTGVGSGRYFPLAAAQRWDLAADSIQNGVYLSHLAALEFMGKMVITKVPPPLPASVYPCSIPCSIPCSPCVLTTSNTSSTALGRGVGATWKRRSCPPVSRLGSDALV